MPKTPRRPLDFYPTPPEVVQALCQATEGLWVPTRTLDPAAGEGHLLKALAGETFGIEIDPVRAALSGSLCADALGIEWPIADVVANPPFGLLDPFWLKVCDHRERSRAFCAMLMPVAWWSAEKRRAYVEPDLIVQLGWRPKFHAKEGDGAHKGSQDFIWAILLPEPTPSTSWIRAPKPV